MNDDNKAIGNIIDNCLLKIIQAVKWILCELWEHILRCCKNLYSKWVHYCKYSKKQRVRKKYASRIINSAIGVIVN